MNRRTSWILLLALLGLLSCSREAREGPKTAKTAKTARQAADASSGSLRPKVVVLIVLDQFGQWVFEKYLPLLPEDGALRRAQQQGTSLVAAYPLSLIHI